MLALFTKLLPRREIPIPLNSIDFFPYPTTRPYVFFMIEILTRRDPLLRAATAALDRNPLGNPSFKQF